VHPLLSCCWVVAGPAPRVLGCGSQDGELQAAAIYTCMLFITRMYCVIAAYHLHMPHMRTPIALVAAQCGVLHKHLLSMICPLHSMRLNALAWCLVWIPTNFMTCTVPDQSTMTRGLLSCLTSQQAKACVLMTGASQYAMCVLFDWPTPLGESLKEVHYPVGSGVCA
jgi:hypothetical protein